MNRRRDESLDIAKGIAIIAVVFGHCFLFPYKQFIDSWHMPLFFIIAGYLYKPKELLSAIKKDFDRLVLPYLFFAILVCLKFTVFKGFLANDWFTTIDKWMALVWANAASDHTSLFLNKYSGIGVIWFLPSLFWCRILYNFLYNKINLEIIRFISCLILSLLAVFLDVYLVNLPLGILTGMSALIFYYIGNYVKTYGIHKFYLIAAVVCWCIALKYSHMVMAFCHYELYPIDVVGACGGTFVVVAISKFIERFYRKGAYVLGWFGKYSLIVLCMHYVEIQIAVNDRIGTDSCLVYLLINFAVIIPLAYLCTVFRFTKRLFQV